MDIQEVIRRLRAGQSDRAIHQELGLHRDTVRKYRRWVEGIA
jgi:DNA-binding CsgD family transcriptional regulator